MNWTIHVLYLGDITIPKSMGTMGLDAELILAIPYLGFLLESGRRKILVDTGIHSRFIVDGRAWANAPAQGGESFLLEALQKRQTAPGEIEAVLYTHLHNDHAGNAHLFTKALHVFHYDEWNELVNPLPSMRIRQDYDPAVIPVLEGLSCRKLVGDGTFTEGIRFYSTPGHTLGGLTFAVDTLDGTFVLPGDIINIYQNLFPKMSWMRDLKGGRLTITPAPERYGPLGVPSGILYDHYAWYRSIWKIRALLKTPKHLLPAHEPAISGKTFPGDAMDLDIPE